MPQRDAPSGVADALAAGRARRLVFNRPPPPRSPRGGSALPRRRRCSRRRRRLANRAQAVSRRGGRPGRRTHPPPQQAAGASRTCRRPPPRPERRGHRGQQGVAADLRRPGARTSPCCCCCPGRAWSRAVTRRTSRSVAFGIFRWRPRRRRSAPCRTRRTTRASRRAGDATVPGWPTPGRRTGGSPAEATLLRRAVEGDAPTGLLAEPGRPAAAPPSNAATRPGRVPALRRTVRRLSRRSARPLTLRSPATTVSKAGRRFGPSRTG